MHKVIIGTQKSGLSLIGSILNCDRSTQVEIVSLANLSQTEENVCLLPISFQDYKQNGVELIDALHDTLESDVRAIWLIRNPLVVAASLVADSVATAEDSLEYITTVNTCIWYFYTTLAHKMTIKFEDLLLNRTPLLDAFEFYGTKFNDQYLDYGDFDQSWIDRNRRNRIDLEELDGVSKEYLANVDISVWLDKPLYRWFGYFRKMID